MYVLKMKKATNAAGTTHATPVQSMDGMDDSNRANLKLGPF